MNWYNVFYWVTVADGVKNFFDAISSVFLGFSIASFIIYWVIWGIHRQENNPSLESDNPKVKKEGRYWVNLVRKTFIWCFTLMTITWAGYVFCPSKKDAVVIIAGGAIGNFITSDSSAKQIPAELTLLVREKMKSEIQELKTGITGDKLEDKTKEELIQLLKNKQ